MPLQIGKHTPSPVPVKSAPDDDKVAKVMREFEAGTLRSSSGELVTSRKQALAIALSEASDT